MTDCHWIGFGQISIVSSKDYSNRNFRKNISGPLNFSHKSPDFHLNRPVNDSKWGTFDLWGLMFSTNGCSKMTRSLRSLAENRPVERKFDNLCEKLFRPGILRIYGQILNVINLILNFDISGLFSLEQFWQ